MELTENITQQNVTGPVKYLTPVAITGVFGAEFLDAGACDAYIIESLHGDCLACPGCGATVAARSFHGLRVENRVRCRRCGKFFTALTGTFLSGTHLSSREIVLLALLLGLGVQDKEVARIIGISAESVRLWRLKFRAQEEIKGSVIG